MDQRGHQILQTLSKLTKSQILKKITQLLVSVSVFSLLLSNSSALSFIHSFNFFPAQLFSHTINKNCIFLLCNGLLIFVVKYSGLFSSSSKYNYHGSIESFKNYEDSSTAPSLVMKSKMAVVDKEFLVESKDALEHDLVHPEPGKENECIIGEVEDGETEELIVEKDEEKGESGFLVIGQEGEESEVFDEEEDDRVDVGEVDEFPAQEEEVDGHDHDDEEGIEVLSTEELNKKFDEFIRKMKEGIRIEAQQQLVMVN